MPSSLLKEAWEAGKVSRMILGLGLIFSAAWAVIVAVGTLRIIVNTLQEPTLAAAYKIPLLIVLAVVVLFLVIPLPAQWLMYGLLRLDERRRSASRRKV